VGVGPGRVAVGDGVGGVDSGICRRATGKHETVSKVRRTADATTEMARFLTISFYFLAFQWMSPITLNRPAAGRGALYLLPA
jgi:hypothetical protein